jgi:hypothetical protein
MKLNVCTILLACCCVTAFGQGNNGNGNGNAYGQTPAGDQGPPEIVPHRTNPHETAAAPTAGSASLITPAIAFHGGAVMQMPTPYLIWYGTWNNQTGSDTSAGQQIVRDFIHGLSGSNYYLTNASYAGVTGALTTSGLGTSAQEFTDTGSQGSSLSDAQIASVVSNAIAHGLGLVNGAADSNGIFFVLTSSDINETSGFCTQYCGWHTRSTTLKAANGKDIKYAFVGNANRCLNACAAQTIGPNGNAGVDGMVSVIAHEMEETNTDPDLNAWYNRRGYEDADMCAWTFGSQQTQLPSGAFYNMTLNTMPGQTPATRNYLIQRQLDVTSHCYVDYVSKPKVQ